MHFGKLALAAVVLLYCSSPTLVAAKDGAGRASMGLVIADGSSGVELAGAYGIKEQFDIDGALILLSTPVVSTTEIALGGTYTHPLDDKTMKLKGGAHLVNASVSGVGASTTGFFLTGAFFKDVNAQLELGGGIDLKLGSVTGVGIFGEGTHELNKDFGVGGRLEISGGAAAVTIRGIMLF